MASAANTGAMSLYLVSFFLFFCGWIITLGGLAASQKEYAPDMPCFACYKCKDDLTRLQQAGVIPSMFARRFGDDCDKVFRFAWWVWAAGLLPMLAEAIVRTMPLKYMHHHFGGAVPMFAFVAPLYALLANDMYNFSDVSGINKDTERAAQVALSGFAIAAAFALLCMLVAPTVRADQMEMQSFTTASNKPDTDRPAVVVDRPVATV